MTMDLIIINQVVRAPGVFSSHNSAPGRVIDGDHRLVSNSITSLSLVAQCNTGVVGALVLLVRWCCWCVGVVGALVLLLLH